MFSKRGLRYVTFGVLVMFILVVSSMSVSADNTSFIFNGTTKMMNGTVLNHTVINLTVKNDTARWYGYMDMTTQAEALYDFVTKTIEEELVEELGFLASYDNTKKALQDIIDMPDRLIDLFIQLCLQNNGRLSSRKRSAHFSFLADEELEAMELAVKEGYNRVE